MITCSFCLLIRGTVGWLLASKVQKFLQLYPIKFLQQASSGLWHEPLHCTVACTAAGLGCLCLTTTLWSKLLSGCHGGVVSNMKRFSAHYALGDMHPRVKSAKAVDCRWNAMTYRPAIRSMYLLSKDLRARCSAMLVASRRAKLNNTKVPRVH